MTHRAALVIRERARVIVRRVVVLRARRRLAVERELPHERSSRERSGGREQLPSGET
jgi:hypothetical protein